MTGSAPMVTGTRARGVSYLGAFLVGTVLLALTVYLTKQWRGNGEGDFLLQSLVMVGTLVVTGVLWARSGFPRLRSGPLPWFVLSLLALWILLVLLTVLRGETMAITSILMPAILVLVWLKPPVGADAEAAAEAFAWSFVGVVLLTLGLEALGLLPHWGGGELAAMERGNYWLPLADVLNLDGRWAGPFVHPNLAGPVGAYLLVFGVTRRGSRRWVFALTGGLVLLTTSSRTAQISAVAGLCTVAALWWLGRPGRPSQAWRAVVLTVPVVVVAAGLMIANPGLTGRTTVWPVMTEMWKGSPLFGVGDAGFSDRIERGDLPAWAIHAHNVFLDAGVRTGVLGLVVVLVVVALAVIITARGAYAGRTTGLALIVTIIVGSLGDVTIHWRYPEVTTLGILLAVLMSVGVPEVSGLRPSGPAPQPEPAPVPGTGPDPDPAPSA